MRELKVAWPDVDGQTHHLRNHLSCGAFVLRANERLSAAVCGDQARAGQPKSRSRSQACSLPRRFSPGSGAGASVLEMAEATGVDVSRVKRFAHPVLLERCCAAELATAAHPVLADGPAVMTLRETVTTALVARGLDHDTTTWDAWKNEDGLVDADLAWQAGRSDNRAHFRFTPGAHLGTVTPLDEAATELIDPNFDRPLRPGRGPSPARFRRGATRRGQGRATGTAGPHASRRAARVGMGRRAAGRALGRRAALTRRAI